MSDSVAVTFRGICIEDLAVSSTNGQINADVLGIGNVPVTPFVMAVSDVTAAAAGVVIGQVYVNTATIPWYLRVRLT